MKIKTMLSGVLCSGLLVSSVNAAEVEFFVGAAAGYQTDSVDGKISHDTEDVSWQGRAGVLIEKQHRITGTFGYMEDEFSQAGIDYKQEQYSWLLSYDYLMPVHKDVTSLLVFQWVPMTIRLLDVPIPMWLGVASGCAI